MEWSSGSGREFKSSRVYVDELIEKEDRRFIIYLARYFPREKARDFSIYYMCEVKDVYIITFYNILLLTSRAIKIASLAFSNDIPFSGSG